MMGNGYWLNPDSGKIIQVGTTHDDWIKNPENAKAIGLPSYAFDDIAQLTPNDVDGIRMAALRGGLVRIRDYVNYMSVEFSCQKPRQRHFLWSALVALKGDLKTHPYTDLHINNILTKDSVTLNLQDLQTRLTNDESVLKEEKGEVHDIPFFHPSVVKLREKSFKEFFEKEEATHKKTDV